MHYHVPFLSPPQCIRRDSPANLPGIELHYKKSEVMRAFIIYVDMMIVNNVIYEGPNLWPSYIMQHYITRPVRPLLFTLT
jgi:hypothetical protein